MLNIGPVFFLSFILSLFAGLHGGAAFGEAIILRSGQQIRCTAVHEASGVITCITDGNARQFPKSDVRETVMDNGSVPATEDNFSFYVWRSGMGIADVMTVAERDDIPLHRQGLTSSGTHYDPKMSRAFMDTATEFYYNDRLLGKPARVTLFFTPQSKLLAQLKIHVHSSNIKRESSYPKEIEALLSEKYGRLPHRFTGGLLLDSSSWTVNDNVTILMETATGRVDIMYSDLQLLAAGEHEKSALKAKRSEQAGRKDAP